MARCDFVNGRLGARRTRLLGSVGLRELLARAELPAQLELLHSSDWTGEDAGSLELGTHAAVLRDAEQLGDEIEGHEQRRLWLVVRELIEAAGIRVLLRALAHGASLQPTGNDLLDALAQAADVGGAVARLIERGHPLGAALRDAMPSFDRYRDLAAIEQALERAVVARALLQTAGHGEDAAMLRRLFELAIDLRNVALWLALGENAAILPGGTVDARDLPRAANRWLGALPRTAFLVDRRLARVLVDTARRQARAQPLSIAVPLAYILERLDEARLVRLIVSGTAFALPADELAALVETS